MIYAFDLDGTLCSKSGRSYSEAVPFSARVEHVNALKADGHEILIFTARGQHSGVDYSDLTQKQLQSWGLQFDYLLPKPSFDVLIDDKAISSESYWALFRL